MRLKVDMPNKFSGLINSVTQDINLYTPLFYLKLQAHAPLDCIYEVGMKGITLEQLGQVGTEPRHDTKVLTYFSIN